MRRPSLGTVASYGTLIAITTAEGTLQFMVPPYLEQAGYPIGWTGLLYGLPFGIALLCRMPAGLVYHPERAAALVAAAGLGTALTALLLPLAPGPLAFGAVQVLHGAAMALSTTVVVAHFLGTHGSGAGRARAMSYFAAAMSGGYMIGNGLSGLIAARWGYGGALVSAALWALACVALARALPPVPAHAPAAPAPSATRWAAARRALADPGLVYAAATAFLLNVLFHVPGGFFPLYALGAGLSVAEVGFIRTAYSFTNTAVRGVCGGLLERVGHKPALTAGIVVQAVGLAALPLVGGFLPLLVVNLIVALGRAVGLVANTVSVAADVDPRRVSRGVASGVFNAAQDVGALVAPAFGGLIGQHFGLESVFRVLPLVAALLFALMLATVGRAVGSPARLATPAEVSRG
ncbi:MAG TPA: MFS transporter [Chloroflexota bacterium]|jgi:MFS family permease